MVDAGRPSTALVYGRLLRISLAPSAAVDVLAGLVLGGGGSWPGGRSAWLVLASLGVYHGAMALNDWADRVEDAAVRPDRPIPSGRIAPPVALLLGVGLALAGVALAAWVRPAIGLAYLGLAAAAVGYDLIGRGAWLGPLLLGTCRAANVGIAAWAGALASRATGLSTWALVPILAYGAYVVSLSRLGRLEDGQDDLAARRPLTWIRAAAVSFACIGGLPALVPSTGLPLTGRVLAALVGLFVMVRLLRLRPIGEAWTPGDVGRCMGVLLRLLLAATASIACLHVGDGWAAPLVVLAAASGYPASFALRRVFPPS